MRTSLARTAVAAALLTIIGPALGAESLGRNKDEWPNEITKRPLTLGTGMLELWLPVQLNASNGADWKPVTANPSLGFGITDEWMIGIRHIVGVCLGGADNGCPNVYNDVGAFTRLSLGRGGGIDFAIQGGVDYVRFQDPTNWAAWAGVILRGGGGPVALTLAPSVSFGLKDRDTIPNRSQPISWNAGSYDLVTPETTFDNREHLSVPVTLQLQLGPVVAVEVGASLEGPLNPNTSSFGSEYRVPAGAAVIFTPLKYLDVGASFTAPQLWGNKNNSDIRALAIFIALRT
jgi:hypothetical protein